MQLMKIISSTIFLVICIGCSIEEKTDTTTMKEWRTYVGGQGHVTHVVPVIMPDGTRCVLVIGNSQGRGVSCDWSSTK